MGRLDEAILQYKMALRVDRTFAYALNNLACALQRQGCIEEAIAYFRETLRIKPDYTEARNNLTRALLLSKLRKHSTRSDESKTYLHGF
jgi:tetratricopeptide (TPR) repeat protein